jgi:hypothetical protein
MSEEPTEPPGESGPGAAGDRPGHRRRWEWLAVGIVAPVIAGVILAIVLSTGSAVVHNLGRTRQPLTVTAHLLPPGDACHGGAGWVFSKTKDQLPAPSLRAGDSALQRWASTNRGIPASGNLVAADLQALPTHTVIINDVRVKVLRRESAPAGVYPVLSAGCGGIVPSSFTANLDRSSIAMTRPTKQEGATGRTRLVPLPHKVSESGPEVWYIEAVTRGCDCQWVAYLDWSSDGKTGSTQIDDNGQPFRTVATTRSLNLTRTGSGRWYSYR